MTLKTPTGDISGTLTIPGNKNTSAVVLIIAGSGPTDRDCNSPMGIRTNAYKMMAAGLADNGISSVRFDKRGIGKSQSAMKSEADIKFETYINDVVKWISFLKADKRFSRIILLGHSEGSLIGIIAAENSNISAFISIAGVGRSADKVIQEQLRNKLTPQLLQESNRILDSLRMGKTVAKVDPNLVALYRPSVQPYMISWIKYDPSKEIAKMKMPALIIQGTTDLQVTVDDAKLLAASKPGARVKIIDNMNHVMKECGNDIPQNMASYNNPNLPLKSGLLDEVVNFIKTNK
jgi:pimeloyl-ACP methyl ester carboxylesterase